jgi:hypothetical protein
VTSHFSVVVGMSPTWQTRLIGPSDGVSLDFWEIHLLCNWVTASGTLQLERLER